MLNVFASVAEFKRDETQELRRQRAFVAEDCDAVR